MSGTKRRRSKRVSEPSEERSTSLQSGRSGMGSSSSSSSSSSTPSAGRDVRLETAVKMEKEVKLTIEDKIKVLEKWTKIGRRKAVKPKAAAITDEELHAGEFTEWFNTQFPGVSKVPAYETIRRWDLPSLQNQSKRKTQEVAAATRIAGCQDWEDVYEKMQGEKDGMVGWIDEYNQKPGNAHKFNFDEPHHTLAILNDHREARTTKYTLEYVKKVIVRWRKKHAEEMRGRATQKHKKARREAMADPRNTFTEFVYYSLILNLFNLFKELMINLDFTTFRIGAQKNQPTKKKDSVAVTRFGGKPETTEPSDTSTGMPFGIHWPAMLTYKGSVVNFIFIIKCRLVPKGEIPVLKIEGLTSQSDGFGEIWLVNGKPKKELEAEEKENYCINPFSEQKLEGTDEISRCSSDWNLVFQHLYDELLQYFKTKMKERREKEKSKSSKLSESELEQFLSAIVGLLSCNGEIRGLDNIMSPKYREALDELRVILMKHGANCSGLHQLCDVCKFFRDIQACLDSGEYEDSKYVDDDAVQSAEDEIKRIKDEFPVLQRDTEWVRKVRQVVKILPQVLKQVCKQTSILKTLEEMGVQPLDAEIMYGRIPNFSRSHGWLEAEINTLYNSGEAAVAKVMTWGSEMWNGDKLEELMDEMKIPSIKHLQERQRQSTASKPSLKRKDWADDYPQDLEAYELVVALNDAEKKVEDAIDECDYLKRRLKSLGIAAEPHHITLSSIISKFGLTAQKPSVLSTSSASSGGMSLSSTDTPPSPTAQ